MWASHDPKKANEMLDSIGLNKKDSEGYRLRTDGKGRLRLQLTAYLGNVPWTPVGEMFAQQVKKIGIQVDVREMERSLAETLVSANEHQLYVNANDGTEHMFTRPLLLFPDRPGNYLGPLYGTWFASGGTQGEEPPRRMREAMDKFKKAFGVPYNERVKLGKEIWKIASEDVWHIGIAGLSPANTGLRVCKTSLGNIPARQINNPNVKTPAASRPQTWYWKN